MRVLIIICTLFFRLFSSTWHLFNEKPYEGISAQLVDLSMDQIGLKLPQMCS